jgi:predicted  nucleic acid-binding Zn-ribbon protein
MMKANDALTNTEWLRDVRDTLQQQSEEIQRLRERLKDTPALLKSAQTHEIEAECYARGMARHYEDNHIDTLEKEIQRLRALVHKAYNEGLRYGEWLWCCERRYTCPYDSWHDSTSKQELEQE